MRGAAAAGNKGAAVPGRGSRPPPPAALGPGRLGPGAALGRAEHSPLQHQEEGEPCGNLAESGAMQTLEPRCGHSMAAGRGGRLLAALRRRRRPAHNSHLKAGPAIRAPGFAGNRLPSAPSNRTAPRRALRAAAPRAGWAVLTRGTGAGRAAPPRACAALGCAGAVRGEHRHSAPRVRCSTDPPPQRPRNKGAF